MKLETMVYSVRDSKLGSFITPFFSPNRNVALRMFESACNDTSHQFNQYGDDFTLFEIGVFDPETGIIEPHQCAENLGLASQFKKETYSHVESDTIDKLKMVKER